ncbi:hypothetical protein MPLB_1460020 [Mesorhizobium sp. ORS 3324]|nr:hypothetical protein MPLB_1460020 [Mesorhizobium sp. ORS 3324]
MRTSLNHPVRTILGQTRRVMTIRLVRHHGEGAACVARIETHDRQSLPPEIRAIIEAMIEARRSIIERTRVLDTRVRAAAKQNAMARLFMTAPGVGATNWLLFAEGLGPADCQGRRLEEGEGCGGAQACRHPPRHVEDE